MTMPSREGTGYSRADDSLVREHPDMRRSRRRWRRLKGAPLPPGVRGMAMLDARRAARAGEYDVWSFSSEAKIAYLERLARERDQSVSADRSRSERSLREVLRMLRRTRRDTQGNAAVAAGSVEAARTRRGQARERERLTLDGLDMLTGINFPRPADPWPAEEEIGVPGAPAAGPEGNEGYQANDHYDDEDTLPDHPAPDADAPDAEPRPGRRPHWLGPLGGRVAPPVPMWLRLAILVLLVAVEVPIYYKIFEPFNDYNPVLTSMFTAPVAVGMVLAPHLAGKLHRNRLGLPREPIIPYLTVAVMLLWFGAGCLLGWLRQQVLLSAKPIRAPGTGIIVSQISQYHVSWWTMTGVFASVLLLSGMIAFILGVADSHPAVVAYQAAHEETERANETYLAALRAQAEADQADTEPTEEMLESHRREASHREAALRAEYQAAELAYLDTVAVEMGDPAVTQGISGAIRDEQPPPGGPA